jgi:hypothetical protein
MNETAHSTEVPDDAVLVSLWRHIKKLNSDVINVNSD